MRRRRRPSVDRFEGLKEVGLNRREGIAGYADGAYSEIGNGATVSPRGGDVGLGEWVSIHGGLKQVGGEVAADVEVRPPDSKRVTAVGASRRTNHATRDWTAHSGQRRRLALVAADLFALIAAAALASIVAGEAPDSGVAAGAGVFAFFAAMMGVSWVAYAAVSGLYRREELRADITSADDVGVVFVAASIACWFVFVASTVMDIAIPAMVLVGLWAVLAGLVLASRGVARSIVRRQARYIQSTLIVGAGDVGQLLGRKLMQHPELGLRLVGFVDDDPKSMRRDLGEFSTLGTPSEIRELVDRHAIDRVIIAFSNERHDRELELVHELRDLDVQIDIVPRLFEAIGPVVRLHYIEGLPLVVLSSGRSTRMGRATKRSIDIVISSAALVVLSPLLLFISWRIKRGSPGPVFFRQERLGQDMRTFELLKFRTMTVDTDEAPHREYVRTIMDSREAPVEDRLYKLRRDDAVTKTGSWLRRSSLDELPQLINVLRGEMSLVGPRPCMAYESELFEPHHFDRFLVPAGITGLWQVTARARTTFKEALDLDVAYVHNWSLGLDVKLLLRTPLAVFRTRETA